MRKKVLAVIGVIIVIAILTFCNNYSNIIYINI